MLLFPTLQNNGNGKEAFFAANDGSRERNFGIRYRAKFAPAPAADSVTPTSAPDLTGTDQAHSLIVEPVTDV